LSVFGADSAVKRIVNSVLTAKKNPVCGVKVADQPSTNNDIPGA
jgi:hypothetical protein